MFDYQCKLLRVVDGDDIVALDIASDVVVHSLADTLVDGGIQVK